MDGYWCRTQYASLARARLPTAPRELTDAVLALGRAIPDRFADNWLANRRAMGQPDPTEKDIADYRTATVLDTLFQFRDVLPEDVRADLDHSAKHFPVEPHQVARELVSTTGSPGTNPSETGPLDLTRMGVGGHTDHECFTILAQDTVEALQVRNRRGQWIDAPPIPGTFVVNIGEQMARWTNGAFASTFHRVYNASGRERYSIPTFVGANADAVIEALPSCVSEENPAKFEPIAAGEYVTGLIYHNIYNNSVPNPAKIRAEV